TVDVGVELAVIDDGAAGGGATEAPAAQAPAAEPAAPAAPASTEAEPEAAASPAGREDLAAESAPAPEAPQAQAQASTPEPSAAPQAAATGAAAALRGRTEPLSRLRKVIATRMVESLQVSAQLTTVVEVDVTRIAQRRAAAKASFEAREGVKLSFLPFFALAA